MADVHAPFNGPPVARPVEGWSNRNASIVFANRLYINDRLQKNRDFHVWQRHSECPDLIGEFVIGTYVA